MAKTAYLNARIDPALKDEAEKVFAGIGVSASQAITMFYRQVVMRNGIPFDICIPNAETVVALKEAESGRGELVHATTHDAFGTILRGYRDTRRE